MYTRERKKNKNGNFNFCCGVCLLQNRTSKISSSTHLLWVTIDSLATFDSIVLDLHFDCNTHSHTILRKCRKKLVFTWKKKYCLIEYESFYIKCALYVTQIDLSYDSPSLWTMNIWYLQIYLIYIEHEYTHKKKWRYLLSEEPERKQKVCNLRKREREKKNVSKGATNVE